MLRLPVDTHIEEQFLSILELVVVAKHEVDILVQLLVGSILTILNILRQVGEVDAVVEEEEEEEEDNELDLLACLECLKEPACCDELSSTCN